MNKKGDSNMNQTDESLQEFWRRITTWRSSNRPSTPELIALSLARRWSSDQISITLSKYLDLIFFFALPWFACAIVTFAAPRYACVGLLCFLLTISSSFIAFHDFQKAAKSLQNRPKATFLENCACAFHHLLVCAFDSKRVRNLDLFLKFF